jgi:uncharacterized protein YceK
MPHQHLSHTFRRLAVALVLTAWLSGCATTMDRSIAIAEQIVTPVTVGDPTSVAALDLAEAMLQAGFTPEQIIEDGPAIRDALALSGGAQVRYDHVAQALFAVHSQQLYVTSRDRGTFTVPLRAFVT